MRSTRVHVGGGEADVFVGGGQATPVSWGLHRVISWYPHFNHGQCSVASEIKPNYGADLMILMIVLGTRYCDN